MYVRIYVVNLQHKSILYYLLQTNITSFDRPGFFCSLEHKLTHSRFRSNMEKKKRTAEQEDGRLQHHLILLVAIVIGLVIMDPFDMSPVGGHDFRPVRNDIAPYDQVMESWPDDNLSRLGLGNLEFVDEVYGPESLEFDPLGNGPYSGLADGRVVKWAGKDRGWETFALVSQKW